jgi:hypothetical protein
MLKDMDFPKLQAFPNSGNTFSLQSKLPGDMIPNYMPQNDFEVPKIILIS